MRWIEPHFPLSHGVPRVDDRRIVGGIIFVIRNGLRWRDAPAAYGPPKTIYNRFIRWSRLRVFDRIFAALAAEGGTPDQLMIDATHLKGHRTAASLLKKGCSPTYRAHQRRLELRKTPILYDATLYQQRHKIDIMFGRLKDWRRIHTRYDRCAHTFMSAICIAATVIFWLNQRVLSLGGPVDCHRRRLNDVVVLAEHFVEAALPYARQQKLSYQGVNHARAGLVSQFPRSCAMTYSGTMPVVPRKLR